MKQGTTYPIVITVPGIDLSGTDWIILSLKPDGRHAMEFGRDRMIVAYAGGKTTLTVQLTEEESVSINPGGVGVDLNWLLDGVRGGCVPQRIRITDTLLKRVVTDDG